IQKALQKSLALYGNKHYRVFHAYHHLGDYYLMIGDTLQQIKAYQKAIIALVVDFHPEGHHQNPVLPLHQPHPIELSKVLSKKATSLVLWYQSTQDPQDLRTAIATYKLSLDFIQQMRQNHQAEGSKLFSSKAMMRTFENAVHATYQLLEATKNIEEKKALSNTLFQFSEESKAALLLSNVKESEAKTNAAIPADLLEEEQHIKQELNELQKKINQQKAKRVDVTDSILLGLQGAYFDLQQIYQQVIQNFETNYPAYFQLKYNIKMVKTADIKNHLQQKNQQNLQYKTAVVSYFVGKKNIYALLFTDTCFEVKQIAKPEQFHQLIQTLQESMQFIDLEDFIEASRELYQHLIAPIEGWIKEAKKLVILRHDVLEYLPFEVLLTKDVPSTSKPIYADLPYLLQEFEICYHYSANLWFNGISKHDLTKHLPNTFLGFAPVTFNGETPIELAMESKQGQNRVLRSNRAGEQALQQLPNTEVEVKDVYQFFQDKKLDAKAFLYGSASKENLMLEAVKHKFILISTHGFVENEEAGLSGICLADVKQEPGFRRNEQELGTEKNTYRGSNKTPLQTDINPSQKDYLFYTSDAYHLRLNADLVVLSSCSSGIGKLEKGEGMMAMNRGFLYAGASNIVFTQFDIPDQSSSLLVKKLFQYILEGYSYPTALQLAKREMIQQKGSSPQDWAGFVLIGC
ncbi:MAG: CHAT domain-containing protein, partial [Chitinophagales bacterium]